MTHDMRPCIDCHKLAMLQVNHIVSPIPPEILPVEYRYSSSVNAVHVWRMNYLSELCALFGWPQLDPHVYCCQYFYLRLSWSSKWVNLKRKWVFKSITGLFQVINLWWFSRPQVPAINVYTSVSVMRMRKADFFLEITVKKMKWKKDAPVMIQLQLKSRHGGWRNDVV